MSFPLLRHNYNPQEFTKMKTNCMSSAQRVDTRVKFRMRRVRLQRRQLGHFSSINPSLTPPSNLIAIIATPAAESATFIVDYVISWCIKNELSMFAPVSMSWWSLCSRSSCLSFFNNYVAMVVILVPDFRCDLPQAMRIIRIINAERCFVSCPL